MHLNQWNGSKISALYELDIAFIAFFFFCKLTWAVQKHHRQIVLLKSFLYQNVQSKGMKKNFTLMSDSTRVLYATSNFTNLLWSSASCFCAKCVHLFLADEFLMLFTLCCGFVASKFCFKVRQEKNNWCETNVTCTGLQVGLELTMGHGQAPLILGHLCTSEWMTTSVVWLIGGSMHFFLPLEVVCFRLWDKSAFAASV